ncbi:hypothetical protein HOF46_02665 [Candidatus Woesearchaeota archaeon]|jgi:Holliday junction resolvase|nr:hypothetical protein [Candidatus Woesearchaeota archaeon]MBT4114209.1 hypothetical protein [Candidatus Woesearchaeota archaeon]
MGTRQGTLLEKNILKIFKQAGFRVKHQERIKRYEIDVFAEDIENNLSIIIECKQYEKSPINVVNLIHQWCSKNSEINASFVIIALYGVKLSERDILLAKKFNITLWDEADIEDYLDNPSKEKILKDVGYSQVIRCIKPEHSSFGLNKLASNKSIFGKIVKKYVDYKETHRKMEEEAEALLDENNLSILKKLPKEAMVDIIDLRKELKEEVGETREIFEQEIRKSSVDERKDIRSELQAEIKAIKYNYLGKIRIIYNKYKNGN